MTGSVALKINNSALSEQMQSLPVNLRAEAALLGALLSDNRLDEDIQIRLREEHFFDPTHRLIYQIIMRLLDRNQLATHILAEQSRLSAEALRMGNITKQDFFNFARASEDLVFISMIRLP